ncbi:MAG: precorrin-2 dehydrogenase/sirohydrochlorin ferrochelatase family protein [Chloroflexota bacterium]
MSGYPIMLVGLENARCVVIGGGAVAARKAAALCKAGARPIVFSPTLCEALERQVEQGEIQAVQREYHPGDLAGARLVIAATDDPQTNEVVWREAQSVGCLVNVVDDPDRCNFHVPATVRRGALTLSISTGGNSPLLARRIRQVLEAQFDSAYDDYLDLLGGLRPVVQEQIADPARRKQLWSALLDSNILDLLREGDIETARCRVEGIVETFR